MKAELIFIRHKWCWNFWAFGTTRYRTRSGKYEIFTIGLGPLRLQYLDWGKRYRFQQEEQAKKLVTATKHFAEMKRSGDATKRKGKPHEEKTRPVEEPSLSVQKA